MKLTLSAISCFAALSAANAYAAIEVPPACQESPFTAFGYQSGYNQGTSLVNQAFNTVQQDCERLDLLAAVIIDNLDRYKPITNSHYLICRYTGTMSAVFQRLEEIFTTCTGSCCLEGGTIGLLSGEMYCQLSILLEGLAKPNDFVRLPVYSCGMAFETCCDAEFINTSFTYVGQNPENQSVMCSVYAEAPWYEVWEGTRAIQCHYTPPPDEP